AAGATNARRRPATSGARDGSRSCVYSPGGRTSDLSPRRLADNAHLELEVHTARLLHGRTHLGDQRLDVGRRRVRNVQDEVRMLVGDHGAADAPPLEPGLLDE